ncbi:hypothetical protein ACFRA1_12550, partial [Bacillus subtilis]
PYGFQNFTVTREDAEKEKQKTAEKCRSLKA